MEKEDGGPAFPHLQVDPQKHTWLGINGGMSMRDYFAAAALTGLLARGEPEYKPSVEYRDHGKYIQDKAFKLADAMIAVRQSK